MEFVMSCQCMFLRFMTVFNIVLSVCLLCTVCIPVCVLCVLAVIGFYVCCGPSCLK